jgi:hypothetical protein
MKLKSIKLPKDVVKLIRDIRPSGVNLKTSTFGKKTSIRNLKNILEKGVVEVPGPETLFMYKNGVGIELEIDGVRNILVRKENYPTLQRILSSKGYEEKEERYFQKEYSSWHAFPVDKL